ncbi:MAG: UDP-N-acetylmuramoyl-L-alanyl-D-glutamate--2,6-diaminopimelate ligase [Phycisphaeraceae bacterium]|nr:UDP-N-acetylmuramoyl-L-alanyl-D-glutamate--2,6-diaminopimelate ligase [Phycisphaeraceae bacterium]
MRLDDLISRANARMTERGFGRASLRIASGLASVRICDVTEDSRTVLPGSLFVARAGAKADGHQFVQQSLKSGAAAILVKSESGLDLAAEGGSVARSAVVESADVERAAAYLAETFYGEPSNKMRCIGVTGTNGKTTVTWLLWRLLNGVDLRTGLIGTVMIDDGNEVARAEMTTPPAIELSRTLNMMAESGCRFAAMEVSSHSLAQKRVAALSFGVGVFTNLTQDHLDFHKTMEEYANAKAELFRMLPADGLALVNTQDDAAERMLAGCIARKILCEGVKSESKEAVPGRASVRIVEMDRTGMKLGLVGPFGSFEAWVPLIGSFNAMNVLQAVCCAFECGMNVQQIAQGCSRLDAPPGRLERVPTRGDEPLVLVDFAHTEDALRNALGTAKKVVGSGRLIAVFGCGGDKDRTKRPKMGRVATEIADVAIITSDNPRTEKPGDIIDSILIGVDDSDRHKTSVQADRRQAIFHAVSIARADDIVVIAGKGHETDQILPDGRGGTETHHFDDREVAREAIAERRAMMRVGRAKSETGSILEP